MSNAVVVLLSLLQWLRQPLAMIDRAKAAAALEARYTDEDLDRLIRAKGLAAPVAEG